MDNEKPEQLSVEVVIIEDDGTAYIMNLERRNRRKAPIWTEGQWREYINNLIEARYGDDVANWFRQLDEK